MIDIERVIGAAKILIQQDFAQNLTEIALVCGKSKQYFSDLKRKKSYPSIKFVDVFCEKYPVNKDYILTGNGEILLSGAGNAVSGGNGNVTVKGNGNENIGNTTTASPDPSISEVLQKLVETNAKLVETNAKLVEMLNKK